MASAPDAVLVLDDDPIGRLVLQRVIKEQGLTALVAATIEEGREHAAQTQLSAAFIDKNLRGENGLDFLNWLREAQPDCATIMVTAYGSMEAIIEALRRGAHDFVLKPYELELVTHRLRLLLDRRRLLLEAAVTQQRLASTDRLVVLGTLSASIVHEVATPLTLIRSSLDALKDDWGSTLPPAASASIEDALTYLKHVSDVIRTVSRFGRNDTNELMPVRLEKALESALSLSHGVVRYRARVTRAFEDAPWVRATESKLTQVFLNLVVNAAHALPEGGASTGSITVRLRTAADGAAEVEVSDNGCGIPDELKPQLFSPFVTTKAARGGTGLGLWISKSVIEGLGGRIELESVVGRGTTFWVILPACEAPEND